MRVQALDDAVLDASPHREVILHQLRSSDVRFGPRLVGDAVAVEVLEADPLTQPSPVLVRPLRLRLSEGGAEGAYTVALASRPTAPVMVRVLVPPGDDLVVEPTELLFGSKDWDRVQSVRVRARL